jgi:transcriptional regulator with XRE-family HTH domain
MGGRQMKILSCRLGKLQKEKHMTTAELSRRTGISKPTLYGYRINKRMPSYAIAYDMAMALGCEVKELFEEVEI